MTSTGFDRKIANSIAAGIGTATGRPFPLEAVAAVGSGSTGTAFALAGGGRRYFVKSHANPDLLAAEADGLAALARCPEIVVPKVIALGREDGMGWLALSWLDLGGGDDEALGQAVAALHGIGGEAFGWHRDNYLGATPQRNTPDDDWPRFFARCRLGPQLDRVEAKGFGALADGGRRLADRLPDLLAGAAPLPSLVHGDLWRGNVGFVAGRPALFDPAVHFGDPEGDLAMADLFGSFGAGFFAAYRSRRPAPVDAAIRRNLHQLYHLLNHVNLFGAAYADTARRCLTRIGDSLY